MVRKPVLCHCIWFKENLVTSLNSCQCWRFTYRYEQRWRVTNSKYLSRFLHRKAFFLSLPTFEHNWCTFYSLYFQNWFVALDLMHLRRVIDYLWRFTKMSLPDVLWMRLSQSAILLVCLRTAQMNPTDITLKFNSLWIILLWHEVQLAMHRNAHSKCP